MPFTEQLAWGRATRKDGKLYLHVFDWPADGVLLVPQIHGKVLTARMLAGGASVAFTQTTGITLKLPVKAPDPIASVIVLDIESSGGR
jgi:alpha-L-fucosidase